MGHAHAVACSRNILLPEENLVHRLFLNLPNPERLYELPAHHLISVFRRGAAPPPKRGQLQPPPTGLGLVVDHGGLGGGGLFLVLAAPVRDDDLVSDCWFNDARGGGSGGKD